MPNVGSEIESLESFFTKKVEYLFSTDGPKNLEKKGKLFGLMIKRFYKISNH